MPHIIPVLDLLNKTVVHGVAGKRDEYQPVQSKLVNSSDPLKVANAFRDHYSFNEIYVADLDAIQFRNYDYSSIRKLLADGFELLVDAGLREVEQIKTLYDLGVQKLVAGMETIPDPDFLSEAIKIIPVDQLVFSLDLMDHHPISQWQEWKEKKPIQIIEECMNVGLSSFIILDLKQVGMGNGLSTLELCQQVKTLSKENQIITGGGIQQPSDVLLAQSSGVDGILISSALHNGNLHEFLSSL